MADVSVIQESTEEYGLLFAGVKLGGHVHTVMRAGRKPHRAKCGDIVMSVDDWSILVGALHGSPQVEITFEDRV
jgi:hypothetical protein